MSAKERRKARLEVEAEETYYLLSGYREMCDPKYDARIKELNTWLNCVLNELDKLK